MKTSLPLLVLPALLLPLAACEDKTPAQKVQDKVDDALNRRPNEKIRDAAEDIRDDTKDAAKKAADATKEVVHDAADAVKDATN